MLFCVSAITENHKSLWLAFCLGFLVFVPTTLHVYTHYSVCTALPAFTTVLPALPLLETDTTPQDVLSVVIAPGIHLLSKCIRHDGLIGMIGLMIMIILDHDETLWRGTHLGAPTLVDALRILCKGTHNHGSQGHDGDAGARHDAGNHKLVVPAGRGLDSVCMH